MAKENGNELMVIIVWHPDPEYKVNLHSEFLFEWYQKLGYKWIKTIVFDEIEPERVKQFDFRCLRKVFVKQL